MAKINLAIAGIGNCASSLLQGIEYYKQNPDNKKAGLLHEQIGGYKLEDIKIVAAFDIDMRKVGHPLQQAVFAAPNCTKIFCENLPVYNINVQMAPVMDVVAEHMSNYPHEQAFRIANQEPCDVAQVLHEAKSDVLICYLPVGSEQAVKFYAQVCVDEKVAMVNCVPVFIASNPQWAQKFSQNNVPIVGDDIKSQVGATIIHRTLVQLLEERGVKLQRTYQLNTGRNTDFLNMLEQARLTSKKISKTESVQSQLNVRLTSENIHIGPSDYVSWQKDNKVCFLRLEWFGFGDVPMNLELRLSVEDSPNSAGVAIDAIRCAKFALDHHLGGPLEAISSLTMKHPPLQHNETHARQMLNDWLSHTT